MLLLTFVVCLIQQGVAVTELFHNADFESSSFNGNWVCKGCTLTQSNDHYHGQHSGQITHRNYCLTVDSLSSCVRIQSWAGIRQTVAVTGGHKYAMTGFIKLMNMSPGHMYHDVKVTATYSLHGRSHYIVVSFMPRLQKDFGWTEIGGDFDAPSGVTSLDLYIEIHEADVNYLVDNMSVKELPINNNWKTEAEQRIQSLRKSTLIVNVNNPTSADMSNMEIEVKQLKHKFAFGSAVGASEIVDPTLKKYQDYFYENFEWAVLENALKWRFMQYSQSHIDYDTALKAIDALRKRGVTVRGHNMFWDFLRHSPNWIANVPDDQLLTVMHTRLNGTLEHTRGKLAHWDVNNENLHRDYYEQRLKNPNITADMFRWMHQVEPGVKLFLNEFEVVRSNKLTTAYKMQAKTLKDSGVPIYGIGIQGHFKSSNIDTTAVKYRLDKIAEAGLPMWITEMSIIEADANKKADALEKLLTLYFSHPSIEGVLFWGFWDGKLNNKLFALANGPNVTSNAAGSRYINLVKQTWRTHVTQQLQHGIHISGYHGDYMLNIKLHGQVIETKNFTLGSNGSSVTVTLNGSGSHTSSTSVFG